MAGTVMELPDPVFERLSDGVALIAVDARMDVVFATRSASLLFGCAEEDLVGRPFGEAFLTSAVRAKVQRLMSDLSEGQSVLHPCECTHREAGKIFVEWTFERSVAPGSSVAFFAIAEDLRSRERWVRRARDMAHSVRNPLNGAGLQLSLLTRLVKDLGREEERSKLEPPLLLVKQELKKANETLQEYIASVREMLPFE